LACLVVSNNPSAVKYYIESIGMPIIDYIEKRIAHCNIAGEFYIFLSDPFDKFAGCPCWHRVSLYKGVNCKLSTYTSNITCRHFCKVANRERICLDKKSEILEYVDYESLLQCDRPADEQDDVQLTMVKKAYERLSDRDRDVLRELIIEKKSGLEAFSALEHYICPKPHDGLSSEELKKSWTQKQKQDAMSLMKGRALERLQKEFKSVKEIQSYD